MPRKKKIAPITREQLIEILEFVYVDDHQVLTSFVEYTDLTVYIDDAVKKINDHFIPKEPT